MFSGGTDWPLKYPKCGGSSQSPINIQTWNTVGFKKSQPIKFSQNFFFNVDNATLYDTGFGYKINFPESNRMISSPYLVGSPYELLQMHFHFGSQLGYGSEHQLNGVHYPAEVSSRLCHFVTWVGLNTSTMQTFKE